MGLINIALSNKLSECPITGEKATYDFLSPNPMVDAYEYKLNSLNNFTTICITGDVFYSKGYLQELIKYKKFIKNMIAQHQLSEFTIDTYFLNKFR